RSYKCRMIDIGRRRGIIATPARPPSCRIALTEGAAMRSTKLQRRQFLAAGALALAPASLRAQNANNRLNVAIIGCGGRGGGNLSSVSSENIVALCDVNETALNTAGAKFPTARKERDFRRLFDRPRDFDAVVVSTCEHTHAFATMLALHHNKHV